MYIILNYIWNRVRSSLKKRILVIDEAWSLMQHEDSAKFLFGLVKRARKYYLGIATITQDVEDFVRSPYGKPIITNSSMQLLLKQAPSAMEALQKIFNLTDGEKYLLLNSGVGQGLFFAGLKHVAIQIIASYSEDKIVTTNPEEILAQGAVEAEFEEAESGEVPGEAPVTGAGQAENKQEVVQEGADQVGPAQESAEVPETEQDMEAGFTENVASVLDAPVEGAVPEAPVAEAEAPVVEKVTPGGISEDKQEVVQEGEVAGDQVALNQEPAVEEPAAVPEPGPVQEVPVEFEGK